MIYMYVCKGSEPFPDRKDCEICGVEIREMVGGGAQFRPTAYVILQP
jgi:hypothetical protein